MIPKVYKVKEFKDFADRLEKDKLLRNHFKMLIATTFQEECGKTKRDNSYYYFNRWDIQVISNAVAEKIIKDLCDELRE